MCTLRLSDWSVLQELGLIQHTGSKGNQEREDSFKLLLETYLQTAYVFLVNPAFQEHPLISGFHTEYK